MNLDPYSRWLRALLCSTSVLVLAPTSWATLQLDSCELPGFEKPGRCGQLTVGVDPSDPSSPTLDLKVVELPALSDTVYPEPIFYLVGGPGRGATAGVEFFADSLRGVQAHHRVVLLDLRGTGETRPVDCGFTLAEKLDLLLAFEAPARLETCRAAASIDPSHLTTREAVRDLETLRQGLGVERVHLLGISYGTRVAQVYAKLYPDHVATLTLRGATVLGDVALHRVAWGGERQLQRTTERCASDDTCSREFPDVLAQLAALQETLVSNPREVPLKTGESVWLTPNHLEGLLRQTVYSPRGSASVPWLLDRLHNDKVPGHLFGAIERQLDGLALEPMLSVFCAEDVPWVDAHPTSDPVYSRVHERFAPICAAWDVEPAPQVLTPVPIDAPTLLLSGSDDPATPAEIAGSATRYLGQARYVVTPGLGHFPTWTSCFARLTASHLDPAALGTLDTSCAAEDLSASFLLESPREQLRRLAWIAVAILGLLAAAYRHRRGTRFKDRKRP